MQFKKVTFTIPERMYDECRRMIEAGYFANISEIIRAGIRTQMEVFLFQKRKEDWFDTLAQLAVPTGMKDEEIIERMRKTRREIWGDEYADSIGQQ